MGYEIKIKKQAKKFIAKQQKTIQDNFNKWIQDELTENPHTAHDGKMINESYYGLQIYKKRFGMFRALFSGQTFILSC